MSWTQGAGFFKNIGNVLGGIGKGGGGFMGNFGTGGGLLSQIGKGGEGFMGKFGTGQGMFSGMGKGGPGFMGKFGTGEGKLANMFGGDKAIDPNLGLSSSPIAQGIIDKNMNVTGNPTYDAQFGDSESNAINNQALVDEYNKSFLGDNKVDQGTTTTSGGVKVGSDIENKDVASDITTEMSDWDKRFMSSDGTNPYQDAADNYAAQFSGNADFNSDDNSSDTPTNTLSAATDEDNPNVNQFGVDESIYDVDKGIDTNNQPVNNVTESNATNTNTTNANANSSNVNQFGVDESIYNPVTSSGGGNVNQFGVDESIYDTVSGSGDAAKSADEEYWDWEEDEHDIALKEFQALSPKDQAKQIRHNRQRAWMNNKWVKGVLGGLTAGAISNNKDGGGGTGGGNPMAMYGSNPYQNLFGGNRYDFQDVSGGGSGLGNVNQGMLGFYNNRNLG